MKDHPHHKLLKLSSFLAFPLVLLLTSCSEEFDLLMFNNTGRDCAISMKGEFGPQSAFETYNVASNKSIIVKHYDYATIWHDAVRWNYPAFIIGMDSVDRSKGKPLLAKLQIEPNGAIYLLPPGATGIVTTLPPQPYGFPVMPINRKK